MKQRWEIFNPYNTKVHITMAPWWPFFVVYWISRLIERFVGVPTDYAREGDGYL